MSRSTFSAAIAVAVAMTAATPSSAAGPKIIPVHGNDEVLLVLTPNYLPDGKIEDDVRLVNKTDEDYCFRFEIYDDHWVAAPRKVSIMTAPPGSAYRVTKVRIYTAGSKYRYKYKAVPLAETGLESRDCRKAFPRGGD